MTPITDLHFDINTKGDDKDRGDAINIQVIKNDTVVIFDSGWIHCRFSKPRDPFLTTFSKPFPPLD